MIAALPERERTAILVAGLTGAGERRTLVRRSLRKDHRSAPFEFGRAGRAPAGICRFDELCHPLARDLPRRARTGSVGAAPADTRASLAVAS